MSNGETLQDSKKHEIQLLDLYKIARSQVEHENTLVSHRITWYLSFQGFLFATTFIAIGLFGDGKLPGNACSPVRWHLAVAIILLGCVGALSSIACFVLVRAAYSQINMVTIWWRSIKCPKNFFPEITGAEGFDFFRYKITGADFLLVIFVVWLSFVAIFINASLKI